MAKDKRKRETTRIGNYEFTVAPADPSVQPSAEEHDRWERRAQTLADWLLSEWKREQEAGAQSSQSD